MLLLSRAEVNTDKAEGHYGNDLGPAAMFVALK